jgi:hypothetical protein
MWTLLFLLLATAGAKHVVDDWSNERARVTIIAKFGVQVCMRARRRTHDSIQQTDIHNVDTSRGFIYGNVTMQPTGAQLLATPTQRALLVLLTQDHVGPFRTAAQRCVPMH